MSEKILDHLDHVALVDPAEPMFFQNGESIARVEETELAQMEYPVFGADLLHAASGRRAEASKNAEIELRRSITKLAFGNEQVADEIDAMLEDYPIDDELKSRLRPSGEVYGMLGALIQCDGQTLLDFCTWNQQYQAEIREKQMPEIQRGIEEWHEKMLHALRNQGLPISEEQLVSRMQQLAVIQVDPLAYAFKKPGVVATHKSALRTVIVRSTETGDDLKSGLWHELMHHASGMTLVRQTWKNIKDNTVHIRSNIPRRVGLQRARSRISRVWLDEAFTEQLTVNFLSEQWDKFDYRNISVSEFFALESGFYRGFRKRAKIFLRGNGQEANEEITDEEFMNWPEIPIINVLAAYFEDYRPSGEKGKKAMAGIALWNSIKFNYPDDARRRLRDDLHS